MARIRVEPNALCGDIYPYQFPAILRVRTREGKELVEEVLSNRGGPDDPLTGAELREKFRSNAGRVYGGAVLDTVEAAVSALADGTTGAADVLAPLGRATPSASVR